MRSNLFLIIFLSLILVSTGCAQTGNGTVKTGLEVLQDEDFLSLQGYRVGLVTNATGVNRELRSTVDILYNAEEVDLVALYGPEHGVRGEYSAGDKVASYEDELTGLPVYSLYGSTRKPTPEMLQDIDVLVYDIQDIGVRSYTYISTLGLVMEAAAEQGIKVVVLDRPNPLGGIRVEGNVVEEGYFSFVSQFPIPYVYGLTVGELALMINKEGWLGNGLQAEVEVIAMTGWSREMKFSDTGLPWVPTSPHIPHEATPFHYVSSGIMGELGVLSEGVGYTIPFEVFGAEWIDETELARRMNELGLEGVIFRPIVYKPYYGRDQGATLHGVQVYFEDPAKVNLMLLQFYFMQVHHELYPDRDPFTASAPPRLDFFDKVAGTDQIRLKFSEHFLVSDIINYLNKDLESFTQTSKSYHLY